jgi:hypothetical protein
VLFQISGYDFVDVEFGRRKRTGRFVLLGNVTGEALASSAMVVRAASCANFNLSVSDDPSVLARGLSSFEIVRWLRLFEQNLCVVKWAPAGWSAATQWGSEA